LASTTDIPVGWRHLEIEPRWPKVVVLGSWLNISSSRDSSTSPTWTLSSHIGSSPVDDLNEAEAAEAALSLAPSGRGTMQTGPPKIP